MGAPASYISLLDRDRQWFKSTVGMGDLKETPRDGTFCDYAIRRSRPTVVLDATRDPLFSRSPYVTDGPKVRFYTGFPLWVGGQRVGTLCTLDFEPRESITEEQLEQFHELALLAQEELARPSEEQDSGDPTDGLGCVATVAFLITRIDEVLAQTADLEPSRALTLVADYASLFSEAVDRWGGRIEGIGGSEMQAVFTDQAGPSEQATRAAGCAIDIVRGATTLQRELEEDDGAIPWVAIGIHQGLALMGSIAQAEGDFLFGWGPRTTRRIAECAIGGQILASQQLLDPLGPAGLIRGELRLRLPGESGFMTLYELVGIGDFRTEAFDTEGCDDRESDL